MTITIDQVLQFFIGLSLLVVLHELGHFLPAIWFKTRVEKFYLFFNPWFSLFKTKIRGTEVGIGWLPLGGFVKISGMIDESMDKDQMKKPPQPWEFRSKPGWQRLIILLGGVTVNVVTAIVIYAGMMSYYGETYVASEDVMHRGVMVSDAGRAMGLQDRDQILSIGGELPAKFMEINKEILHGADQTMEVLRGDSTFTIQITNQHVGLIIDEGTAIVNPRPYFIATEFTEESLADDAGMQVGDKIVNAGGVQDIDAVELFDVIPTFAGDTMLVDVLRGEALIALAIPVSDSGKIGVDFVRENSKLFPHTTKKYSGFGAVTAGWNKAFGRLSDYTSDFGLILTPETGAAKKAGGFLTILTQFPEEWNWEAFWGFTAFLSLALAFLNVLPIPALDGGHALFVIVEMITGRAPSTRFMEIAQVIGFFILVALLLLVNGNDVGRLLSGS